MIIMFLLEVQGAVLDVLKQRSGTLMNKPISSTITSSNGYKIFLVFIYLF